jgi:pimeloyl-ACP methyl ester carboxylesterase
MIFRIALLCVLFLSGGSSLAAQEETLPQSQRVEVTAPDGIIMVADYYVVPGTEGENPSLVLLHGSGSNRGEWNNVLQPFLDSGFNVLAVDLRAHGETGGKRDLVLMIDDVQVWLDWLREQPSVNDAQISIIGSSMGTVPALAGCALDAACVTTILLSPGDFPLLDEAMFERLHDRSILFVIGRGDNAYHDTRKLFDRAVGEVAIHIYDTPLHATAFFSPRNRYRDGVLELVIGWLNDHLRRAAAV